MATKINKYARYVAQTVVLINVRTHSLYCLCEQCEQLRARTIQQAINDSLDNPPVSRILAVPTQPEFLMDAWIEERAVRPMPTYSVPGMIDHF